ncbi:hypothetical protein CASFOL_002840 [Castilleja foliolosa]|uniref:Uncharacterized protein n=1 Tax=Castilleja foliolosa TaxID=1961234 RepID=A0ABD3EFZ8_9LAMI
MNTSFQENFDRLKFINDILMEEDEDWENNFFMFHDSLALQATEKSFYDALNNHNLDHKYNSDDHLLLTNSVSKDVSAAANGHQIVSQMNPSWISGSLCETHDFDTFNLRYEFPRHGSRLKDNKTGDHYVMKKRKAGDGDFTDDQRMTKKTS